MLSSITRWQASQAVSTTQLTFDFDNQVWTINGLTYDPARLDVNSRLSTVYIWQLVNNSYWRDALYRVSLPNRGRSDRAQAERSYSAHRILLLDEKSARRR